MQPVAGREFAYSLRRWCTVNENHSPFHFGDFRAILILDLSQNDVAIADLFRVLRQFNPEFDVVKLCLRSFEGDAAGTCFGGKRNAVEVWEGFGSTTELGCLCAWRMVIWAVMVALSL